LSAKRPVAKRFCRQKSCRENGIDSFEVHGVR
jgi:hypothetical protein